MSWEIDEAPSTQPGDVVDAHVHLFTVPLLQEFIDKNPDANPRFKEALKERKFGRRGDALPDYSAQQAACWYLERLHAADVKKALVVGVTPDSDYTRDFIVASRGHIHALASIDPRLPESPRQLELEMEAGYRGVKLLPVNRCFRVSDPECRPFFARASELGANIIVHYGITVDPGGDLRYANPIDLAPVARDFPDITFVIAHFGAGYLAEVLQLGYAYKNVCVDTSGTNNWMDTMPYEIDLPTTFRRTIAALGPDRVLFGTDSGTTAPYRTWIRRMQQRTVEELGLTAAEQDLIMRANVVRIFRLDDRT
ncbi:MAG: amidohydrolase family protein [Coriobacteriales bacterium]|nr:amidohydrolase family protein [Coriobacteriales bacterium]